MNLALWLERAGKSHAAWPALAIGSHVTRSYGEAAERVARLASALRSRLHLKPADRVAIAARKAWRKRSASERNLIVGRVPGEQ